MKNIDTYEPTTGIENIPSVRATTGLEDNILSRLGFYAGIFKEVDKNKALSDKNREDLRRDINNSTYKYFHRVFKTQQKIYEGVMEYLHMTLNTPVEIAAGLKYYREFRKTDPEDYMDLKEIIKEVEKQIQKTIGI